MTVKTAILYHSNCYDGFGAAYAAWKKFGNEAEYHAVSYQFPPPDLAPEIETVYIVDFSYPLDVLKVMAESKKVVVLDHHKTAQESLEHLPSPDSGGSLTALFDMDRSGAVITWEFFHTEPTPLFLQYIQDRDLWKFSLPKTKEFHAWIRSHPFDFNLWDTFVETCESVTPDFLGDYTNEGEALLRAADQTVEMMCKKARWAEIAGHKAIIVNATCHWSEVGHHLLEQFPDADFAASYGDVTHDKVMWSLRSKGDFDVSAIAKQFGGGGHKNAAGCNNLRFKPIEAEQ